MITNPNRTKNVPTAEPCWAKAGLNMLAAVRPVWKAMMVPATSRQENKMLTRRAYIVPMRISHPMVIRSMIAPDGILGIVGERTGVRTKVRVRAKRRRIRGEIKASPIPGRNMKQPPIRQKIIKAAKTSLMRISRIDLPAR